MRIVSLRSRSFGFLIAFFVTHAILADANSHDDFSPISKCEQQLLTPSITKRISRAESQKRTQILTAFNQNKIFKTADGQKIIIEPLVPIAPIRIIELPSDPKISQLFSKTLWSVGTHRYEFIDVGFKQLEAHSEVISRIALDHILNHPEEILVIELSPSTADQVEVVESLRWAVHSAVLGRYASTKPYLSQNDLNILNLVSRSSSHSDVIGLLSPRPLNSLEDLSQEELAERLRITIQITYFGDRNYLLPNVRSLLATAGLNVRERFDRLPFEYRIEAKSLKEFRQKLYSRIPLAKSCEISRYAKFSTLHAPFQNRLIFEAFDRGMKNGMTHFVASTDAATARLFKRYGFKVFDKLPTGSKVEEFLVIANTKDPDFQKVFENLKNLIDEVKVEKAGEPL